MEVGPGNGERIFRTRRAEPREQAVEGDDEDVPLCVSDCVLGFSPLTID